MVLGVVIDADGRPVCTEIWPGNTADVSALLPIVDRLKTRFAIGRVCIVADRGMISGPTIAALEERGLAYVLGVRERTDSLVRRVVLEDSQPFTPLVRATCQRGRDPTLGQGGDGRGPALRRLPQRGRGQPGCRRSQGGAGRPRAAAEAGRQGADRQLGLPPLPQDHDQKGVRHRPRQGRRRGPVRRHLHPAHQRPDQPVQAVLRYRDLLQVEDLFRTAKALLRTRPIYHSSDAAIRGHVFCSFLALVLRKELDDRCHTAASGPSGATCCVTSTVSRKSSSPRTASA